MSQSTMVSEALLYPPYFFTLSSEGSGVEWVIFLFLVVKMVSRWYLNFTSTTCFQQKEEELSQVLQEVRKLRQEETKLGRLLHLKVSLLKREDIADIQTQFYLIIDMFEVVA